MAQLEAYERFRRQVEEQYAKQLPNIPETRICPYCNEEERFIKLNPRVGFYVHRCGALKGLGLLTDDWMLAPVSSFAKHIGKLIIEFREEEAEKDSAKQETVKEV